MERIPPRNKYLESIFFAAGFTTLKYVLEKPDGREKDGKREKFYTKQTNTAENGFFILLCAGTFKTSLKVVRELKQWAHTDSFSLLDPLQLKVIYSGTKIKNWHLLCKSGSISCLIIVKLFLTCTTSFFVP